MLSDKVKTTLYIIIACITIVTALFGVYQHFAKTTDVEKVEEIISKMGERIDISINDDQIFQQHQEIDRFKNLIIFERKEKIEMTETEKEIIKKMKKNYKN